MRNMYYTYVGRVRKHFTMLAPASTIRNVYGVTPAQEKQIRALEADLSKNNRSVKFVTPNGTHLQVIFDGDLCD